MTQRVWRVAVAGVLLLAAVGFWLGARSGAQRTERLVPRVPLTTNLRQISTAINGLELDRAEQLLRAYSTNQPELSVLRASLALHRGDCDEARAIVATIGSPTLESVRELSAVAEGCSRAMAAARIVNDAKRLVWVRLQNDADASWVSLIADVATMARATAARQLGVSANLPLRIELVMDHQSLSALTGLPVEAAENTGTVAVARWGRVTMLSPRSFAKGYPWQDTLAHEITHLLVTRASHDNAPLWLQEAVAKHLETAWRPARPLDKRPDQHEIALTAWHQGRSVGIDRLGPSIAMLPDPDAASIAYAEVYDFLDFLLKRASWNALRLLFRELSILGQNNTDGALRSATGYALAEWIRMWQVELAQQGSPLQSNRSRINAGADDEADDLARRFRLAELYVASAQYEAVVQALPAVELSKLGRPQLHSLVGLAHLQLGSPQSALEALGDERQLLAIQGEWLALYGRALSELGRIQQAGPYFDNALAYAPTDELIVCEGHRPSVGDFKGLATLPIAANRLGLCLAARVEASARQPSFM